MTDTIPHHLEFPCLRSVEAFPYQEQDGVAMYGLRDISQLSNRVCVVSEAALRFAGRFDGSLSIARLAEEIEAKPDDLRTFIRMLDEAHLLQGPVFDAFLDELHTAFDAQTRLPVRAGKDFTAARMDEAIRDINDDSILEATDEIVGLVAPHLDFDRGEPSYAAAWSRLRGATAPDRVIVLGTNHFGRGTGVVLCEQGYDTTVGTLDADRPIIHALKERLGPALSHCRLDHTREHSVELQMPWIRHLFGNVPVVGLLIHDPTFRDGESYDGEGVSLSEFIEAMRAVLDDAGGRTLIVASADLSHVGPEFGDQSANSEAWLAEVEAHDRAHLDLLLAGQVDTFLASMKEKENPTRWCTIGAMAAMWRLLPEAKPVLHRYHQASDAPEISVCTVTSAAMTLAQRVES